MQTIEWTRDMSVGSDVLDGHHKMIVDCLNRLGPLIGESGHDEEIQAVVTTLEEFVLIHFSEEEQQIRAAGFPEWEQHKRQHDEMFQVVHNLKADIEHGRVVDAKRLHALIFNWLVTHILGEDRKYVPYLRHPHPETRSLWTRASGRAY